MREADDNGGGKWASDKIKNMMMKMGWEAGKGLGHKKQGIVEPVQAILRPGRGAVGAYGNETKGLKFGETAGDAQRRGTGADEFDDVELSEMRSNAWKKSNAGKVRPKYKTLDDVVREGSDLDQPQILRSSSGVKFIDMTGPEQKVYDSIDSFKQRADLDPYARRSTFNVPALSDNLDHLLLNCKNEIQLNNHHLQDLKQKTAGMERDKLEVEQYVEEAAKSLDRVESVLQLVKQFDHPTRHGLDALIEFRELFQQIKTEFPVEFVTFGLDCLIEFKVLPLMKQLFSRWNPLDSLAVDYGIDQVKAWHQLLVTNENSVFNNRHDSEKASVYDLLMWHAWMPIVQRAATRWDPRTDYAQMIELIATWFPYLPPWLQDILFDNVVIQKIRERVEDWDPINDEIPIDEWVLPWHDVLGDRLLVVYPQIRQKLASALRHWQPTDVTAIAVLKPWKKVFTHSTMQAFLNTNIVPKLEQGLQRMNLNPALNNNYEEYYAVLEWHELLSPELICDLLVRSFFQRWYDNLCYWLGLPNSLEDVARYYREWKERIPAHLAQMKPIHVEFVRALMAIKQTRDGLPIQRMPSFDQTQTPIVIPREINAPSYPNVPPPTSAPTSFKQLVELKARELGIIFAPQPNRNYNGHAVYWFGDKSIYIDGTAILAYDTIQRAWKPISLEHLIATL